MEHQAPSSTPTTSTDLQFLTVPEAAARLRLHEVTLRRLIGRGLVPVARIGSKVLVPVSYFEDLELDAWSNVAAPTEQRGT